MLVLVPVVTLLGGVKDEDLNCSIFFVNLGDMGTLSLIFSLILDLLDRILSLNSRLRDLILFLAFLKLSRVLKRSFRNLILSRIFLNLFLI